MDRALSATRRLLDEGERARALRRLGVVAVRSVPGMDRGYGDGYGRGDGQVSDRRGRP